ncbi:MAG: class I SAM-dependent methyltransferase [Chitinophagales bacterium]|nr:class I SAM-dependent methyltransferase [Chitinophagales bacterium]
MYSKNPDEKLGWYESDFSSTLNLIHKTALDKAARILNIGAGSTHLVDELLKLGYANLIATDISKTALERLEKRLATDAVKFIVDDLTKPTILNSIEAVDLWIDRAVLHFFTKKEEQDIYFDLLKELVKKGGFVLLAEFSLDGATVCSGLPVFRYSEEMFIERLGADFQLIDSFSHTYIMPSGAKRPYIYTLFKRS